mmetsp:Transcript_12916/g.23224  ORF Transcript_12916/g.23224 Transcript_12916/m.23224 type:complete len:214 (+) Transcript_12916:791-1432(+)
MLTPRSRSPQARFQCICHAFDIYSLKPMGRSNVNVSPRHVFLLVRIVVLLHLRRQQHGFFHQTLARFRILARVQLTPLFLVVTRDFSGSIETKPRFICIAHALCFVCRLVCSSAVARTQLSFMQLTNFIKQLACIAHKHRLHAFKCFLRNEVLARIIIVHHSASKVVHRPGAYSIFPREIRLFPSHARSHFLGLCPRVRCTCRSCRWRNALSR